MTRLEGTIRLAGLLEGPYATELEPDLRQWMREINTAGVQLEFSHDGVLFSIIPRTESPTAWRRKTSVDSVIRESLQELLERLPDSFAKHCMCTLRSVEILPGQERQTLYSIGPGNTVVVDQRDVAADTEAPPEPVDPRKLIRHGLIGSGILLLLVLISIPFVPYRDLAGRIQSNLFRTPAAELQIHRGPFSHLIEIPDVSWDKEKGKYRVTCQFASKITDGNLERYWADIQDVKDKLAAEDIIRGRLMLNILSEDGKSLGSKEVILLDPSPLTPKHEIEFLLPPYAKMKIVQMQL